MQTNPTNIGNDLIGKNAAANTAVTAGGAGDNTVVTGLTFDRQTRQFSLSAVVVMAFTAVLAQAATLTLKNVVVEDGDASDMSDAATFATLEDGTGSVVSTGGTGGTTNTGEKQYNVSLAGARRYVRVKFTPDLSAANTDTAKVAAVVVFGGENVSPAV